MAWRSGLAPRPGAESLAPAPHHGVPRCPGALARGLARRSGLASTLGAEISAPAPRQGLPRCSGPWREAWLGDPALPRVMARRSPHKPRPSPAPRRADVLQGLGARPGAELRPCLDAWRGDPRTSLAPAPHQGVPRCSGALARRSFLASTLGAEILPCLDAWRGDHRTSLAPAPHQGVPRCSGALARGVARRSGLASTLAAEIPAPAPRGLARRSGPASTLGAEISAQASHQREASARRSGLASTLGSKISAPRLAEVLRGPSARLGAQMRPCLDAWRGDLPTSPASWRFTQSTRPV